MNREDKAIQSKEEFIYFLDTGNEFGEMSGYLYVQMRRLFSKVFDHHEAELKAQNHEIRNECQKILSAERLEIDNRVCEKCIYLNGAGRCSLGIQHFEIDTDPDKFGCNKWDKK